MTVRRTLATLTLGGALGAAVLPAAAGTAAAAPGSPSPTAPSDPTGLVETGASMLDDVGRAFEGRPPSAQGVETDPAPFGPGVVEGPVGGAADDPFA